MDDPARIEQRHWLDFDPTHLKDLLRDRPAWKMLALIDERDAAIAERDTAMADKKTANAERDAALLQRDVAYADRDSAWFARDTALAALTIIANKDNVETPTKLMHMVNIPVSNTPAMDPPSVFPLANSGLGNGDGARKQHTEWIQEGTRKRNGSLGQVEYDNKKAKGLPKDVQQPLHPDVNFRFDNGKEDGIPKDHLLAAKTYETFSTPIPYCSCTGTNQQCYRWGKGGWQSACCTNMFSMYPLPTSQTKRGARVPGRKMSGGAFKKILEKLAADGVDICIPIDLKHHWAKHGTNRYVTIK